MKKLDEIIQGLIKVRDDNELEVSDNVLFEQAVKIYNTSSIKESKQSKSPYHEEPATEAQKALLKKINKGVVPAGISKKEASTLIQELKDKYEKRMREM